MADRFTYSKGDEVPEWLIAHQGGTFGGLRFMADCEVVLSGGRYWVLPHERALGSGMFGSGVIHVDDQCENVLFFAPKSDVVVPFRYQTLEAPKGRSKLSLMLNNLVRPAKGCAY